MSLARCLGVGDEKSPLLVAAVGAWPRWCAADPELAVVNSLADLPAWTRRGSGPEKDVVLGKLAALTAYDSDAVAALVWLLVPRAVRVAASLGDLHQDIDALVAGQLWIEVSNAHMHSGGSVAVGILARTRHEVCADLGVGALARRRDRTWVESVRGSMDETAASSEPEEDPFWELTHLMIEAMENHAVHVTEAILLDLVARAAAEMEVGAHRGRLGLTTPAVAEAVATNVHQSARAIRRRTSVALDRMAEYVRVRNDPGTLALWRASHPTCALTPAEELHLVITDDCDAHFFRARDLPPGAWAPDLAARRVDVPD